MANRKHVLTISAATPEELARQLVKLAEDNLIGSTQYTATLHALVAYLPATIVIEQRQARGAIYASVATPTDTYDLSFDPRGRVTYK